MLETIWQDTRYGLRMLIKYPAFTLVATATLALGIGANTAIFTVVNAVLLRPLPYPEPEQIVRIGRSFAPTEVNSVNMPQTVFWRERSQSLFESMAAYRSIGSGVNLSGGNEPEYVPGLRVSADFFRVLGVFPTLGRSFAQEDDNPNGSPVVIISNSLWRRRFGANSDLVGKTVLLNGETHTVVGIMPEDFQFPSPTDVIVPLRPVINGDTGYNYRLLARLKRGVTREQATAEMKLIGEQFRAEYPKQVRRDESVNVLGYQESLTGDIRPLLLILLVVVSFVLLISCTNVANLQLMRSTMRAKEIAVRLALGARWQRILRQLLTEGILLSLLGGVVGLVIAICLQKLFAAFVPDGLIPRSNEISLDIRVLLFTFASAVLTGIIFGLAPALQTTRVDFNHELKGSPGKTEVSATLGWLRNAFVVSQVALSLILLIGAGLMIRSFANLRRVELGFDPQSVLTFQVALSGPKYDNSAKVFAFYERALEAIRNIPGVDSAAVTNSLPLAGNFNLPLEIDGQPNAVSVETRLISPNYFQVLRQSVKHGRAFSEKDDASSEAVVIVNQAFAQQYFGDAEPINQRVIIGRMLGDSQVRRVIGVVGDAKQIELRAPPSATIFMPISQVPEPIILITMKSVPTRFAIRTVNERLEVLGSIKREMLSLDSSLPVANIRWMEDIVSRSFGLAQLNTALLGIFGTIGLILAMVGIYTIVSYSVMQRTREIGVRMALGAKTTNVLKLVVGRAFIVVLIGLLLGLAGAWALARILASVLPQMFFDVSATDSLTFVAVALLLALVGLAACYIPARRATKIDPSVALRYE